MTTYLNVTDAVGPMSNHGITRTERQLARALLGHDAVAFVAMNAKRLWQVDRDDLAERLDRVDVSEVPVVERFGVDDPPRARSGFSKRVARVSADRRWSTSRIGLRPVGAQRGDQLVSVGLDWAHGLMPEAERLVVGHGCRYVGFCYDMIPADHPEWLFPPDPHGFLRHFARVTRVASAVLCISESTRRDFRRHFPEYPAPRVQVAPLGADLTVEPGPIEDAFAASLHDGEPYAVYCATLDRRKNHQQLYRAVSELVRRGERPNFVFVGKLGNGVRDLLDCLRNDPAVAGRFVHVTHCDDRHLAAIYRRAAFAVYPSLYEGWGLGVTEALAHGTPCLIASGSSLGEAGLGVCRELHPLRTAEWTASISEYFAAPQVVPPLDLPTWQAAGEALLEMVTA